MLLYHWIQPKIFENASENIYQLLQFLISTFCNWSWKVDFRNFIDSEAVYVYVHIVHICSSKARQTILLNWMNANENIQTGSHSWNVTESFVWNWQSNSWQSLTHDNNTLRVYLRTKMCIHRNEQIWLN